jgi:hypothetical protein
MDDVRQFLTNELAATTGQLQQRVQHLQQDLSKLQQMVNESNENPYQFHVWTQGGAAQRVTEIASLLSRQQTLQELLPRLPPDSDASAE